MGHISRRRPRHRFAHEALEARQLLAVAGDLLFNELMYHPGTANPGVEYLELLNMTSSSVDLSGWRIRGAIDYSFPSRLVEPGRLVVVPGDSAAFAAAFPTVENVVAAWDNDLYLPNTGATLELIDPEGQVVDRVAYAHQGDWALRAVGPLDQGHSGWVWTADHDGVGSSLELINPMLGNDSGQNWAASTIVGGTPGSMNSVASADVTPLIADVSHQPPLPASTDPVVVSFRPIDELADGVTATLYWRVDGETSFQQVSMVDNGHDGDVVAADRVYSATIPAQADGTIIEHYVSATDEGDQTRYWPAGPSPAAQPLTTALYRVDDSLAAISLAPGDQPIYELIMTESQRQELADVGHDVGGSSGSQAQFNATLIVVDGTGTIVRHNVGVSNQQGAAADLQPNSYRVHIPADQDWNGITSFSLNTQFTPLQHFGLLLYQLASVPVANSRIVQVHVNGQSLAGAGQPSFGAYAHVEEIDARLATRSLNVTSGSVYRLRAGNQPGAAFAYEGADPAAYRDGYELITSEGVTDYSDLIQLIDILNNSDSADLIDQLDAVIDIDQWLRYFAVSALLDNSAGLAVGDRDDAFLYHVADSSPMLLMPHQLDSLLGMGIQAGDPSAGIFRATAAPAINRFLQHEQIAPRYYQTLDSLIAADFAAGPFDALLDRELGGYLSAALIADMKSFMDARREHILTLIAPPLTVESDLPIQNGYHRSDEPLAAVSGQADGSRAEAVYVNGLVADYSRVTGAWSRGDIPLSPGINRLIVESTGDQGQLVDQTTIDIWYVDDGMQTIFGTLGQSTTLTAADGPYFVSSMLTVPTGITLTIEPGTTLFFDSDAGIDVRGRIVAEGSQYSRIRWTRVPTANDPWQGVEILDSLQDNSLKYIDQDYADDQGWSINIDNSRVIIDHMTWSGVTDTTLELSDPMLIVRNSHFPGTASAEVIHGTGLDAGDYFILDGNVFADSQSQDDVVDFTGGQRPGPIFQVLNNVFLGGNDDGIDLDGTDAHVEGNIFMNFHRQGSRDTTSNAIATGDDSGDLTEATIVRNLFFDNDHHILLKEDAFLNSSNNVFYGAAIAAVQFNEPGGTAVDGPGRGADFDGDIFWNNADLFLYTDDLDDPDLLTMRRSIVPQSAVNLGPGLIFEDPRFVDPANGDFRLRQGSPALGSGPNGLDMGALVPSGASISGAPTGTTRHNDFTLNVAGPGITSYRYRINGEPFSNELTLDTPIVLADLADGQYTVDVIGKNSADVWQPEDQATSRSWTVDSSYSRFGFNELLVDNTMQLDGGGNNPGLLELYNDSNSTFDASGMRITDDLADPDKFVFPPNFVLLPDSYVVLLVGEDDGTPGNYLGFTLDPAGGQLYLLDTPARGGGLLEEIVFGRQLPDKSLGRTGADGQWELNAPTLGDDNVALRTGTASNLRINEWFTSGEVRFDRDFVEVVNQDPLPVDIGGVTLSTDFQDAADNVQFRPLSFVDGGEYLALFEGIDDRPIDLDSFSGWIELTDVQGDRIDLVHYGPQTHDYSQGREPDGAERFAYFEIPTPGVANGGLVVHEDSRLIAVDDVWAYDESGTDLGTQWREPDYDDSSWETGAALLYNEPSNLPAPKNTLVLRNRITHYFRTHFDFSGDPTTAVLRLTPIVDDGAVFYLNGVEVFRIGMPAGEIAFDTEAERTVGNANFEGPFEISTASLIQGDNVLAAELHQQEQDSSDVAFGMVLDVTTQRIEPAMNPYPDLTAALRITELHYDPLEGDGLEFIELQNVGNATLDLTGVRLAGAVEFTFDEAVLDAGQYVVVVSDLGEFQARYGQQVNVAGQYEGRLSNQGARVWLQLPDPYDAGILGFSYDSGWYPLTAGQGQSLNIVDPAAAPQTWSRQQSWYGNPPSPGSEPQNGDVIGPTVQSVQLNAGQVDPPDLPAGPQPSSWQLQRSDLRTIVVTFSEEVLLDVGDLQVVNLGVNVAMDEDLTIVLTGSHVTVDGNLLTIRFGDDELPDGVYQLVILDSVTDLAGNALNGDGDEVNGGSFVMAGDSVNRFYNLTGDFNGDGGVTIFDFPVYSYWFGAFVPAAPSYLDLNRDGGITIFDFAPFAENFGTLVSFAGGMVGSGVPIAAELDGPGQVDPPGEQEAVQQEVELRRVDRLFALMGRRRGEDGQSDPLRPSEPELALDWEEVLSAGRIDRFLI